MSWLTPTAYDRLIKQKIDEPAQAAEAERDARRQKDLEQIAKLAGQVTELAELLPRSITQTQGTDVTELLTSLGRVQMKLEELTQTYPAERAEPARKRRLPLRIRQRDRPNAM